MGNKITDEIDKESMPLRLEMLRLMTDEGLSENDALIRVTPEDRNRRRRLSVWVKNGLWPMSDKDTPFNNHREDEIMSALTPDMVAQLVDAANKLAAIEEVKLREPSYRPRFRGKRRPTSVRLPKLLEESAMKKAVETGDANRTGNTLAGLIDLLLWRYCDCDVKLLGDPKDEVEE